MADTEDGLLAIEVDADDYAEAAAGDTPSVSRTHQSAADFEAVKSSYTAKTDGGNAYRDLVSAVPALENNTTGRTHVNGMENGPTELEMSKKDGQLLGYAVGELYYDKDYTALLGLCERVQRLCDVDDKTKESLARWVERCRDRMP